MACLDVDIEAERGGVVLNILKLDAGGIPQCWIDTEDATRHYADNSVLWTLGDPVAIMRGGMSRLTGRQSIIELPVYAMARLCHYQRTILFVAC